MSIEERIKRLAVKIRVMRRAGVTAESSKKSAQVSRRKLMRSEDEIAREAPRVLIAS